MKRTLRVAKNHLLSLNLNNHIGLMIMARVNEAQCYRDKVCICAIQMRTKIDFCMCSITGWKFDHLDLTTEIEREKVTGMSNAIILSHNSVNLIRSWSPIAQIIHRRPDPSNQELTEKDQQNSKDHADANRRHKQMLLTWHRCL